MDSNVGGLPRHLLSAVRVVQGLETGVVHSLEVGGDLAHLAFRGARAAAVSVGLRTQALDGAPELLLERLALGSAARAGAAVGAEAVAGMGAGEGGHGSVVGNVFLGGRLVAVTVHAPWSTLNQ